MKILNKSETIITYKSLSKLEQLLKDWDKENIFILTDSNTNRYCLPQLLEIEKLKEAKVITILPEDKHKTIETATEIWSFLVENLANRNSLLINLGGGVVTDIGGFVAATFKRGINYINIATTLLGAVDAATGGKTGINFKGFKNEIGAFAPSVCTIVDIEFFKTLNKENILSGYAEMLKHTLISDEKDFEELLTFDFEMIDFERLKELLEKNIKTKEEIVENDPYEKGIRKALNFGHTIGHAIESFLLHNTTPVLHGYAIAWGMISELHISTKNNHFPIEKYNRIKTWITEKYGKSPLQEEWILDILELMKHDKKNRRPDEINFTLLSDIGQININQQVENELIVESLHELI